MSEAFDAVDVIVTKRDKGELSDAQVDWVIDAYTRGHVAHEQMAALAMAILLNGMTRREISRWTAAMIASGDRMDFSSLSRDTADKHSTGGVGDKITLPLTPLVAACGVAVPQLSGRGLGHTGGTLDKLESIPGWTCDLTDDQITQQLDTVGGVIAAAGSTLAPADKLPATGRVKLRDHAALGAQGRAVGRVLHVAADDDPAVIDEARHSDGEGGVRRIRRPHDISRGTGQQVPVDVSHAHPFTYRSPSAAGAGPCPRSPRPRRRWRCRASSSAAHRGSCSPVSTGPASWT